MSDPELAALSAITGALDPLDQETRVRVLNWAAERFLRSREAYQSRGLQEPQEQSPSGPRNDEGVDNFAVTLRASTWLQQHGIPKEQLSTAFHREDDRFVYIGKDLPGSTGRAKTRSAYLLAGAMNYLTSGEARFTDKEARDMCVSYSCYDRNNHSVYIKSLKGSIVGSKTEGYALTHPGLNEAADLIKSFLSQD